VVVCVCMCVCVCVYVCMCVCVYSPDLHICAPGPQQCPVSPASHTGSGPVEEQLHHKERVKPCHEEQLFPCKPCWEGEGKPCTENKGLIHVMRSTNPLYVSCRPSNLLYTPLRMGYIYTTVRTGMVILQFSLPDQCCQSNSQTSADPAHHCFQYGTCHTVRPLGTEAKFVHTCAQDPTCRMLTISLQHTQHSLIPKQDGSGLGIRLHTIASPHPIK